MVRARLITRGSLECGSERHSGLHVHLPEVRPIFHNEADFQHAVAWELHRQHPEASIRLERRVLPDIYLNILVSIDSVDIALELKYMTHALTVELDHEKFQLRQRGAQPPSRYDILNDLVRIERLVDTKVADTGFVLVLTNDPGYWQESRRTEGVGAAFSLHQGRRVTGILQIKTGFRPREPCVIASRH